MCKSRPAVGSSWLNARWSYGRAVKFKFLAWSSIVQSVCQRAFSLLAIWCLRPWVRILHSAEEDNLSPFDVKIAYLGQSIKHVTTQLHQGLDYIWSRQFIDIICAWHALAVHTLFYYIINFQRSVPQHKPDDCVGDFHLQQHKYIY